MTALLLRADGKRPTQATAASFLSSAKGSPLASTLSTALAQAVEHGVAWADKARKALVRRNSGQQLVRGLKHITLSVDRASNQLALLQVPPDLRCPHCGSCTTRDGAQLGWQRFAFQTRSAAHKAGMTHAPPPWIPNDHASVMHVVVWGPETSLTKPAQHDVNTRCASNAAAAAFPREPSAWHRRRRLRPAKRVRGAGLGRSASLWRRMGSRDIISRTR